MKHKIFLILGGIINFATAILHTFLGHADHMSLVFKSDFNTIDKTVLLGVWHMVSIVFFMSCYPVIKKVLNPNTEKYDLLIRYLGVMYMLFGLIFIASSIYMKFHAAQWVLLIPIGILFILGSKKIDSVHN